MVRLAQLLSAWLADLSAARVSADRLSAALREKYDKDPVLKFFPAPRLDIKTLRVELKFAVKRTGPEGTDILVEAQELAAIDPDTLSTATFVIGLDACRGADAADKSSPRTDE